MVRFPCVSLYITHSFILSNTSKTYILNVPESYIRWACKNCLISKRRSSLGRVHGVWSWVLSLPGLESVALHFSSLVSACLCLVDRRLFFLSVSVQVLPHRQGLDSRYSLIGAFKIIIKSSSLIIKNRQRDFIIHPRDGVVVVLTRRTQHRKLH